jgi:hypothetical protein
MFTVRHETIHLENPAAGGTGNSSVSYVHAAKPETPKQTLGYNGYILVENICPVAINSA